MTLTSLQSFHQTIEATLFYFPPLGIDVVDVLPVYKNFIIVSQLGHDRVRLTTNNQIPYLKILEDETGNNIIFSSG